MKLVLSIACLLLCSLSYAAVSESPIEQEDERAVAVGEFWKQMNAVVPNRVVMCLGDCQIVLNEVICQKLGQDTVTRCYKNYKPKVDVLEEMLAHCVFTYYPASARYYQAIVQKIRQEQAKEQAWEQEYQQKKQDAVSDFERDGLLGHAEFVIGNRDVVTLCGEDEYHVRKFYESGLYPQKVEDCRQEFTALRPDTLDDMIGGSSFSCAPNLVRLMEEIRARIDHDERLPWMVGDFWDQVDPDTTN